MKTTTNLFAAQLIGFIAGINKHLAGKTLRVLNEDLTDKQLIAIFQPCVDAAAAAKQADQQRTTAHAEAIKEREAAMPYATSFKNIVLEMFKGDAQALADFELTARRAGSPTAATKAAAAKKGMAPRAALGTKGPAQKKKALKALEAHQAAPTPAPAPAPAP